MKKTINPGELKMKVQEGYSISKLLRHFNCSDVRLKKALAENNLVILNQRKFLSNIDKENIVIDFNNGISIAKIMEKYHLSESKIRKILTGRCIFDKKNYELNETEIQFLKENAANMTIKELAVKLGRKSSTLKTVLADLGLKYKVRNCKGELWEWKGFEG